MKKSDDSQSTITLNMEEILSLQDGEPLKIEQVEGLGAGRTFRLLPLQEMTLGRESISEIYLDDKLVSRRHAKLSYRQKHPEVVDLESANGTFINDERVGQATLSDGDRLKVGTCVFKLAIGASSTRSSPDLNVSPHTLRLIREALELEEPPDDVPEPPKKDKTKAKAKAKVKTGSKASAEPSEASRTRAFGHKPAFSGRLTEINLTSLLQTLAANRSTGSLSLRFPFQSGAIYLESGELVHATFENIVGSKGLYRMLALTDGEFEFFRPGRVPEQRTITGGIEKHLLEGARHMDELPAYREQLPDNTSRLVFVPKQMVDLSEVPSTVLEVMAVIGRLQLFGSVLEESPLPDLDVCRIVLMLIQQGIIKVVPESEQVTELTSSPSRR